MQCTSFLWKPHTVRTLLQARAASWKSILQRLHDLQEMIIIMCWPVRGSCGHVRVMLLRRQSLTVSVQRYYRVGSNSSTLMNSYVSTALGGGGGGELPQHWGQGCGAVDAI